MSRILTDNNVIVTGGNSGIGKAVVEAFAKERTNVIFTYRTPEKKGDAERYASELSQKYGGRIIAVLMNVEHSSEHRAMLSVAKEFFGREPDILVNNAGILDVASFDEVPEEKVKKVMDTNFIGPFLLAQKVAKIWVDLQKQRYRSGEPLKESYQIINIGSISGSIATGLAIYESSKAAMKMFTKAIAYELAAYHIFANNIAPGLIPTEMNAGLHETELWKELVKGIPMGRTGTPEAIASIVIEVAKNTFMSGSTIKVDGGRCVNHMGAQIHNDNKSKLARES